MSETIYKLQPDRTLALRGFDGFASAAAIHNASPNGFRISGTFRDPADFAVAVLYDSDGSTKEGMFRIGVWKLDSDGDRAFTAADSTYTSGQAGDVPVTGDWNSSGAVTRTGIYRNGFWILDVGGNLQIKLAGVVEIFFVYGGYNFKPLIW